MGQFDQTARPLAKADGAAFFAWAFSCCPPVPRLVFVQWEEPGGRSFGKLPSCARS